jgi:hypothetical protein
MSPAMLEWASTRATKNVVARSADFLREFIVLIAAAFRGYVSSSFYYVSALKPMFPDIQNARSMPTTTWSSITIKLPLAAA